ncbi:MAG: polysaccharide biosynthesis C-terminal domain-containing protein, partial [Firmicutes bacterium]|nr:polysaccharide biosynthesis C-terminal domain-containing protein [Bacillota bacterium]
AAVLQALGAVYVPVGSLLFGIAIKFALNFLLVPRLGIDGAAVATVFSFAVATWLNWRALRIRLGLRLPWRQVVIKPTVAAAVMAAFCYALAVEWQRTIALQPARLDAAAEVVAAVTVAVVFYGVMLALTGALVEEEVAAVPAVGHIAARVMRRLGLFAAP